MSDGRIRKAGSEAAKGAAISLLEPEQVKRLVDAAARPDNKIDLSAPDAPEVTDWSGAVRGKFYKPVKALKSLRLDADVLAWFQAQGTGYQTRINEVLREAMLRGLVGSKPKRAGRKGG